MTQEELLKLANSKNKEIINICKKIKKEVKHLPDINAIGRINNYLIRINTLQVELELLKNILI